MNIKLIALGAVVAALAGPSASAHQCGTYLANFAVCKAAWAQDLHTSHKTAGTSILSMKLASRREPGSIGRGTFGRNLGTKVPSIHQTV